MVSTTKWQPHHDQDDHHEHHHHSTPNHGREQLLMVWKWGSSWEGDNDGDKGTQDEGRGTMGHENGNKGQQAPTKMTTGE
jgi:hypothetical protein